jgi:16S rRNA (guanine527-N7)-methyltransferase
MFHVKHYEAEPTEAALIFGDNVGLARKYTDNLAQHSDTLGLLGPRELPRIWSRHVINSALVAELLPQGAQVADIGSGAGLPGIPMAIARPDCHFTLIEPMERRSQWLSDQVAEIGLTNVTVLRARAEEVGRSDFDLVTARAVAPLKKLLKLIRPLISPTENEHPQFAVIKGGKAGDEILEAKVELKKLGFTQPEIKVLGTGQAAEPVTVVTARLS